MSSFPGPLERYLASFKGLSVDNFAGSNLNSSAFFLSHMHTDHMVGMKSIDFLKCLERRPGTKLYTSELTKRMLLRERNNDRLCIFKRLEPYIVSLPVGAPVDVFVPGDDNTPGFDIRVTSFDAKHCIGSVMFLFERGDSDVKRLLYTGDIRLSAADMCVDNMPDLYTEDGKVKHIDVLCIDTTFCHEQAVYIPSISDSAKCLRDFVYRFVHERDGNRVLLNLPAKIGHEPLFECCFLALDCRSKIHVTSPMCDRYLAIPEMAKIVSDSVSSVPVHFCCDAAAQGALVNSTPDHIFWCKSGLPRKCEDDQLAIIRPSIMHFADDKIGPEQIFYRDPVPPPGFRHRTYHLCYSCHSSLNELKTIVSLLRPVRIVPNVVPKGSSLKEAQLLLENSLRMSFAISPSVKPVVTIDLEAEEVARLPKRRKVEIVEESSVDNDSSGFDFTPDGDVTMPVISAKKLVRGRLVAVPSGVSKIDTKTSHVNAEEVISISSSEDGN